MLPLILVSFSTSNRDRYIDEYIRQHMFSETTVHRFFPDKSEFPIAMVRELKKELHMSQPKQHLYILFQFDTASLEAQNALLKTLEEKNERFQFILTVSRPLALLPTIRSRCKTVVLDAFVAPKRRFDDFFVRLTDSKKNGLSILAESSLQNLDRSDALELTESMMMTLRSRLGTDPRAPLVLNEVLRLRSLLQANNLNPQLTIDNLLIFIHKTYTMKP